MSAGWKTGVKFFLLNGQIGFMGLFLLWLAGVPVASVTGSAGWWVGLVAGPSMLLAVLPVLRRWPPKSARPDALQMGVWLMGLRTAALAATFVFSSACEELFFRAGVQTLALRLVSSPVLAVLLSAAFFTLAHLRTSTAGIISGLLGGLVLGGLFALTGGIWAGVLAHAVYNTGFVLIQRRVATEAGA